LHDNEGAIAFYQASGFVADGTRRVKTRPDGTTMTIARYRRRGIQRSFALLRPVFGHLF
jgi:ribosomal protein S18 acetylase RimI-like enzyme